jgi:hypothetical protein
MNISCPFPDWVKSCLIVAEQTGPTFQMGVNRSAQFFLSNLTEKHGIQRLWLVGEESESLGIREIFS